MFYRKEKVDVETVEVRHLVMHVLDGYVDLRQRLSVQLMGFDG